jgi:ABC-type dipeptide/oligopeptide/nickel transport system ATPase component
LQSRGKTVILISHDMKFVAQAAEYVYELNGGHIVHSGPAVDYFKNSYQE